jgi:hypothetical protein
VTARRGQPELNRTITPSAGWRRPEWPPKVEAHIAKVLAAAPPLGPRQREALRKLLDLGGHDDTP